MGGVFGRWNEAVGEAVAATCSRCNSTERKLVVEVDDPAWATQLRFLETTLKQRLLDVAGATIDEFEITGRGRCDRVIPKCLAIHLVRRHPRDKRIACSDCRLCVTPIR